MSHAMNLPETLSPTSHQNWRQLPSAPPDSNGAPVSDPAWNEPWSKRAGSEIGPPTMPARLRAAWMRPPPSQVRYSGLPDNPGHAVIGRRFGRSAMCRVVQGTIRPEAKSQRARRETLQKGFAFTRLARRGVQRGTANRFPGVVGIEQRPMILGGKTAARRRRPVEDRTGAGGSGVPFVAKPRGGKSVHAIGAREG